MRLSLEWLGDFCALPSKIDVNKVAHDLTMHTAEVEEVNKVGEQFNGVIAARIERIEPHPNTEHLRLAIINTGKEKLTIVCGVTKAKAGDMAAYAPAGAKIIDTRSNDGSQLIVKRAEVKGVKSNGMLCTAKELGLGEDHSEAFFLPDGTKLGQDIKKILNLTDIIFNIDNHSLTHRADLWGHWGWARELHALYGWRLKDINLPALKFNNKSPLLEVHTRDKKLCARRISALITNVKIAPSPSWLAKRVEAIGERPINNIVDITNYVMFAFGRPLHAFDAETCRDSSGKYYLEARHAKNGEKLFALDEKEYALTNDMVVLATKAKALDIAGVMGGLHTGITEKTTSIIYEAANFSAANIRHTSMKLGLQSEASNRFSKGLPPALVELGLKYALQLTHKLCPEAKIEAIADTGMKKSATRQITTSLDYCNTLIGRKIDKQEIKQHLERLGFNPKVAKNHVSVTVPWWRAGDIKIDNDVVEEIARVSGYEKIKPAMPTGVLKAPSINEERQLEWHLRSVLSGFGIDEVYTYPFVGLDALKKLDMDKDNLVEMKNPISKEASILCPSLLPNLLQAAKRNLRYLNNGFAFYEIGKTFSDKERLVLTIVMVGSKKDNERVFRRVQEVAHGICQSMHIDYKQLPISDAPSYYHPNRSVQLEKNKETILRAGELYPNVITAFDIDTRIGIIECELATLLKHKPPRVTLQPISRYPKIERDLAIIVDDRLEYQALVDRIKKIEPRLIARVDLFDIYKGKQIPDGKKSLAVRITYQSMDSTLEDRTVSKIQSKVCAAIKKDLNGVVRDS